jgi:hypothetical protein
MRAQLPVFTLLPPRWRKAAGAWRQTPAGAAAGVANQGRSGVGVFVRLVVGVVGVVFVVEFAFVVVGVQLAGLGGVVRGVRAVAGGGVGVMSGGLDVAALVVLGGLAVMPGGLLVVIGGVSVVLGGGMRRGHGVVLSARPTDTDRPGTKTATPR